MVANIFIMARQPIQVAIYIARYCNEAWSYLVMHRIPDKGNFWQPVTGGVEYGEEPYDAARREMIEETGIEPLEFHSLGYSFTYPIAGWWKKIHDWDADTMTEHVFYAIVDGDAEPKLSPDEHDCYQWLTLDDAVAILHWDDNRDSLRRVDAVLSKRQ